MIRKQYEEAARFHGHACPGLAIGVRAAAEALRLLEITERDDEYYFRDHRFDAQPPREEAAPTLDFMDT